jgi:hypothetical protein
MNIKLDIKMKNLKILFSIPVFILCLSFVFLMSCGEDDSDPKTVATDELSKTWQVGTVKLDGIIVTVPSYENFSITFSNSGTYTTQNGDPIFSGSGTWSFDGDNFNAIVLSGVLVNVAINATSLSMTFTAQDAPLTGRVKGLSGAYEFDLVAQ